MTFSHRYLPIAPDHRSPLRAHACRCGAVRAFVDVPLGDDCVAALRDEVDRLAAEVERLRALAPRSSLPDPSWLDGGEVSP